MSGLLDKLIAFLFVVGVIAIPFDAIAGIKALGELSNETSFYFFALALGLYGLKVVVERGHSPLGTATIWLIGAILIALIFASTFWNFTDISMAQFHDRAGTNKLLTSVGVIIYGLFLAWLACASVPGKWYRYLVLPICVSATLAASFGTLEALNQTVSVPVYSTLNSIVHAGSDTETLAWGGLNLRLIEQWDTRLRSVSFEPPAFGNFAGLAWPWVLCGVLLTKKSRRALHLALLSAFTLLIVVSQARTGWLLLSVDLVSFGLLRFILLPREGRINKLTVGITGAILLLAGVSLTVRYALNFDGIIASVVNGNSVSDLGRMAYQVTALKIFAANPILGVGLGQFAFHVTSAMPSWGFFSPEIIPSLFEPGGPWPNVYSMYPKLAAELGLVGLLSWVAIWLGLMVSVYQAARTYTNLGCTVPVITYPLIMSSVAILATGVTTDTFRIPMIWITLGASACFIARSKQLLLQSRKQLNEPSKPVLIS